MRYVQLALHCFTWHLITQKLETREKTVKPDFCLTRTQKMVPRLYTNANFGSFCTQNMGGGKNRLFWYYLISPEKWYPSRTRHLLPEPLPSLDGLHLVFYSQNYYNNDIVKMFFCHKENMYNMLWLRPLLAFLMAFRIGLTTPQEQQSDCQFPSRWKGTWYHSGFPHPLNISANHISSKGTCVQHQESMFIMVDR